MFGYSFILLDIHWQPATWIEHFHRHRAQIEERLKESKLGQALRHLPSGNEHANRVWLTAALLALNLTTFCCDLCPAAGASGKAPDNAPLRRAAKTLRNLMFTIPARIVRTGRRVILRPPAGLPPPQHHQGHARSNLRARALTVGTTLRQPQPAHTPPTTATNAAQTMAGPSQSVQHSTHPARPSGHRHPRPQPITPSSPDQPGPLTLTH